MGKEIHKLLASRGHDISFIIDQNNQQELAQVTPINTDVAIEFSAPASAFDNICQCLDQGVKVMSGTTGWLEHMPLIQEKVDKLDGTFFYASNYSLGVNIFFHLNQALAKVMADFDAYQLSMEEIHHTEKLDQPSGTAITLAEGVINQIPDKTNWVNKETTASNEVGIVSTRLPGVPGTHVVSYSSEEDVIEIKHTAASRRGFAMGAVKVAEWIQDQKGVLSMQNYLKLAL